MNTSSIWSNLARERFALAAAGRVLYAEVVQTERYGLHNLQTLSVSDIDRSSCCMRLLV